jgi:hypothetical protein
MRSAVNATPVASVANAPGDLNGLAVCEFEDDSMTLIVHEDGTEVTRHYFCSSYGRAAARTVQDARGKSFVLLSYAEGRGTNATAEYLAVFRLDRHLVEYVRTPLSMSAGAFSRWHYDPQVETLKDGGIRLILRIRVEGDDAALLPPEKTRVIEIGAER